MDYNKKSYLIIYMLIAGIFVFYMHLFFQVLFIHSLPYDDSSDCSRKPFKEGTSLEQYYDKLDEKKDHYNEQESKQNERLIFFFEPALIFSLNCLLLLYMHRKQSMEDFCVIGTGTYNILVLGLLLTIGIVPTGFLIWTIVHNLILPAPSEYFPEKITILVDKIYNASIPDWAITCYRR